LPDTAVDRPHYVMNNKPRISIILAARNMERELPRTLHTLTPAYQLGVQETEYEVIVLDCGSTVPIDHEVVREYGRNFQLLRFEDSPSPARAINQAVQQCTTEFVMVCIDGARMLSPGILRFTFEAFSARKNPIVATLAWHLGPKAQMVSMLEGYDQVTEDLLLETIDWQRKGYELFRISTLAGSSSQGWFMPIGESNCIAMRREWYDRLGGLDERFQTPGGGYVNLDFYKRACEENGELVILLGEGTFHQFHGGAATNMLPDHPDRKRFRQEYKDLKGGDYFPPELSPIYLGTVPPQTLPFVLTSASIALSSQV
jgi:glycosyltransferase involved in cell wall biosynthesis